MKVYILVEHCGAWGGVPDEMDDILLGVFAAKEDAEESLWQHASYLYSQEGPKLILEDGKAHDGKGTTYLEIMERDVL